MHNFQTIELSSYLVKFFLFLFLHTKQYFESFSLRSLNRDLFMI